MNYQRFVEYACLNVCICTPIVQAKLEQNQIWQSVCGTWYYLITIHLEGLQNRSKASITVISSVHCPWLGAMTWFAMEIPSWNKDPKLVGLVSYCKLVYNTYFPFSLYMNHASFQLYDDHVGEINQPAYYPWGGVDHYNEVILSAMAYQVNGLCEGNSSVAGELPAQGSTTRKMFLFDVVMFLAW